VESKSSFDGRGNGNSSNAGTARRLNLTAEEARSEVQRLIDMGVWRNYQPISIWPQVSERAAASLIIRRWREKKSVKLRLARRKADAAFGVGPPVGTPEHGSEHDVNRTGPFTAAGPATRDGHKRELSF
jgi:DNA-binding Lrp family transcriptional regulator